MPTLSVPLTDGQRTTIKKFIECGFVPDETEFARQAIIKHSEDLAVEIVLRASREPSLKGDLDALASQL